MGEFGFPPTITLGQDISRLMAALAFVNHLLFAGTLFAVSVLATWLVLRARILDVPNHRSSHDEPIANSGGIAIAFTVLVGFLVVYAMSDDTRIAEFHMVGFALAAFAILVVSFLDDLGCLRTFKLKLATQIIAVAVLLAFDIVIRRITLPVFGGFELGWFSYPVTLLWIVGVTNMFNFMDGLNGLAGGTAVIVSGFFALTTFLQGSLFVYILCYVLLASSLGFLIFNFPVARIFMGDVGSQFLGFVFAAMAVLAAEYDASRTSLLVMPLLLFNFIFDTGFTFCRRLLAGENITQAHRSHLYQLFNRLGYSHTRVSLFQYAVAISQGLGVLWLLQSTSVNRSFVFLPFLCFQIVYMLVVMRAAHRKGLI